MRKFVLPALAMLAAATSAQATETEGKTIIVSRAAPSTQALEAKIEKAAERACVRPFIRDLKAMVAFNACVDAAVAEAMEDADLA